MDRTTSLQVDLGDTRRFVALVRGEAYFKVAKDPSRPFFVRVNTFAVRAVGTEFAVSRREKKVIVTVAEGAVRVSPSSKSARDDSSDFAREVTVPVAAEEQLRIFDTWPTMPSHVDVRYALAWRNRQLMFRAGDTLASAAEEFNLRNRVQLRLDPSAASLPVRGSFDASDPVAFARTMDSTSPIAVEQLSPDVLLLKAE